MSKLSDVIRKNRGGLLRTAGLARLLPGGAAIGAGLSLLGSSGRGRPGGAAPRRHTGSGPGIDFGDVTDLIRRVAPGGARGRGRVSPDSQTGKCPVGYHPAKDGNGCVKNRSMNPLNPRALRKALRRAESFEKIARRTVNGLRSGPKKYKKAR